MGDKRFTGGEGSYPISPFFVGQRLRSVQWVHYSDWKSGKIKGRSKDEQGSGESEMSSRTEDLHRRREAPGAEITTLRSSRGRRTGEDAQQAMKRETCAAKVKTLGRILDHSFAPTETRSGAARFWRD